VTRYFFATAYDLLLVFCRVEAKREVRYTLMGLFESRSSEVFKRGEQLPSLRLPPEGPSTVCCSAYLVTPADVRVNIREVPQRAGGVRYVV
jgi:hypothetical protein